MEHAITYKDLYLSLGDVISMEELQIVQKPGCHGELILSAVLQGSSQDDAFYELPETVTVYHREEEQNHILFEGIIADSSMKRIGNHIMLWLKAYDATYLMNQKRKIRSFQNINRTGHSVIDEIISDYPKCSCIKNIPEQELGRIWFQYEETDWEFLCRFLSSYGESLYADAVYQTAHFAAGLGAQDIGPVWEDKPYYLKKNLEHYDFLSQNGYPDLSPWQFEEYCIESYGIYALGSRLTYRGGEWYIGGVNRKLTGGLLVCTYKLQQKAAMVVPQIYNTRLTGISVDGTIAQVQRDRVRAAINGDLSKERETYWFPFSTVAASLDGSGWYSMPENGDSIRVYFPTRDEKEAYVITKHSSHVPALRRNISRSVTESSFGAGGDVSNGTEYAGKSSGTATCAGTEKTASASAAGAIPVRGAYFSLEGEELSEMASAEEKKTAGETKEKQDPMGDPDKRNIFTENGNLIQLDQGNILLSSGSASVSMLKGGNITINAPKGISFSAGTRIELNAQDILLTAATAIELNNDTADINLQKFLLTIQGQEIFEN